MSQGLRLKMWSWKTGFDYVSTARDRMEGGEYIPKSTHSNGFVFRPSQSFSTLLPCSSCMLRYSLIPFLKKKLNFQPSAHGSIGESIRLSVNWARVLPGTRHLWWLVLLTGHAGDEAWGATVRGYLGRGQPLRVSVKDDPEYLMIWSGLSELPAKRVSLHGNSFLHLFVPIQGYPPSLDTQGRAQALPQMT